MVIRELEKKELYVLNDFLYEVIYQPKGTELLPRNITDLPEIKVYIDGFGEKKDDYCLVAEINQKIVGVVWVRILAGDIKGYGNVDPHTPEFAISLYNDYRNKGIGTKLMEAMIGYLKQSGYKQTSLSVNKDNYAVKMYKKLGFEVIHENSEDYLMLLKLQ